MATRVTQAEYNRAVSNLTNSMRSAGAPQATIDRHIAVLKANLIIDSSVGTKPTKPAGSPIATTPPSTTNQGNFTQDAFAFLDHQLRLWGINSLGTTIRNYLVEGYSPDTVMLLLQDTKEYKTRFAGNETRRAAGMQVLSPAEYLSIENSYRQILRAAGMPPGFYDDKSDFATLIGKDVSPTEVRDRAALAATAVNSLDTGLRSAFTQRGISPSMLAAYYLDPGKALPMLQQQWNNVQVSAAAMRTDYGLSIARADEISLTSPRAGQAQDIFQEIKGILPEASRLSSIHQKSLGGDILTKEDLESELFFNDPRAIKERKRLASMERALFEQRSGVTSETFRKERNY